MKKIVHMCYFVSSLLELWTNTEIYVLVDQIFVIIVHEQMGKKLDYVKSLYFLGQTKIRRFVIFWKPGGYLHMVFCWRECLL